jgi:hypothetical protein
MLGPLRAIAAPCFVDTPRRSPPIEYEHVRLLKSSAATPATTTVVVGVQSISLQQARA